VWCALVIVLFGMSPELCRESVYGVYSGEQKIGRLVLALSKRDGTYVLTTEFSALLAMEGQRTSLRFREQKSFDGRAPHRLLRMTHDSNLAGAPVRWSAEVAGERCMVTRDGATTATPLPDQTLEAALAPALFVRTHPAVGTLSVDGRIRLVARAKEIVAGALVETLVLEEDGEKSAYIATGELFSGTFAGLRIRKELDGGVPEIALATRVAAVTPHAPTVAVARAVYVLPDMHLPATSRQKIARRVQGQMFLEVSADTLPTACQAPAAALGPEPPHIAALATQLADGLAPRAAINAFAAWIAANIAAKDLDGTLSAAHVLAARAGDCSERAELFAALCRAHGIPARRVAGLLWHGDGLRTHAWCEVQLDTWREIDPASGAAIDARGILLWREKADVDLLALLNRTVRVLSWTPATE
jgi:hypothetical protein